MSASLRNARYGANHGRLAEELGALEDQSSLKTYLRQQGQFLLSEFFEKRRAEGAEFSAIYKELRAARSDRGLSNSEAALAAALWGAKQHHGSVELRHLGLSAYFGANGETVNADDLRDAVLWADAIVLAGPVYFGDRGSLAQSFFEFLVRDEACRHATKGKVFGGVTVGAKRNGGQETALIYQMIDACNLSMLAVGNDHSTTSQYGGTAVAGDVGTFHDDDYGINTCIGTGMRAAAVAGLVRSGETTKVNGKVRIGIWLLQDSDDSHGLKTIEDLRSKIAPQVPNAEIEICDFTDSKVHPCIACDICPIEVGNPEEYRCIIKQRDDVFVREHERLISYDGILVAAYSPRDRSRINSIYQRFIERTRYLRRDDYRFGDRLCAPLVISELGANQNLHLRMLTSMVRHDTVIHHPVLVFEQAGKTLNSNEAIENAVSFCRQTERLTAGRLQSSAAEQSDRAYNPIGYIVSSEKAQSDRDSEKMAAVKSSRAASHSDEQDRRLTNEQISGTGKTAQSGG